MRSISGGYKKPQVHLCSLHSCASFSGLEAYASYFFYTPGVGLSELLPMEAVDKEDFIPNGTALGTADGWYQIVNENGSWIDEDFKEENKVTAIPADATGTIRLAARWKYTLSVENGSGDGDYWVGTEVPIVADEIEGATFLSWVDQDGNVSTKIADPTAASTTATIKNGVNSYTATYHYHTFEEKWVFDETSHWHTCTAEDCPDQNKLDFSAHTDGYTADEDSDTITSSCSVCGYGEVTATLETADAVYSGQPAALGKSESDQMQITYTGNNLIDGKPVEVGTYTVTMHWGNASVTAQASITPRTVEAPKFDGLEGSYSYTGSEITPTFVLRDDLGNEIPETEYTVSIQSNNAPGKATIIITDNAGGNYTVCGTAEFEISGSIYDLTGNGIVNLLDITRAQRFYGLNVPTADFNGSGLFDTSDLILILNNMTEKF